MSLTSQIRYFVALDTSSTTGAGKTGLAFGDFTAKYLTEGGTLTSLTTETITTLGTYQAPSDSAHIRIKELAGSDPSKGIYEVHFHNTTIAAAGVKLWLFLSATGAAIQPLEVDLIPYYADVRELLGTAWLAPAVAGTPDVNAKQLGGQAASLNANNLLKVSLNDILATALTETSTGYLAAAFKKLFDVVAPVLTSASVNQTGDSYAKVNDGTFGLSAIKTLIDSVSTSISNLNNLSALANLYGSPLLEIPDSGSTDFAYTLVVRDNEGKLVDLDGSPTIAAANAAGTSRSANLSAVSHPATGRYTFTYSVASDAAEESLRITCSGTVSAEGRYVEWIGAVVNYDSLTALNTINSKADDILADTNELQTNQGNWLTATGYAVPGDEMDLVDAPNATAVAAIQSELATGTDITDLQTHGDSTWASSVSQENIDDIIDGVTGAISTETRVVITSPHPQAGELHLNQGDDYTGGRAIDFTNSAGTWQTLSGTIKLRLTNGNGVSYDTANGAIILASGPGQKVTIEIPHSVSSKLRPENGWLFQVIMTPASGDIETLEQGKVIVSRRLPAPEE